MSTTTPTWRGSVGQISEDLRELTRTLMQTQGAPTTGGLLGGEFGYGAEFENNTFEMHPFYWGECECGHEQLEYAWTKTHDHSSECYQSVIRARGFLDFDSDASYEEKQRINETIVEQVCQEMGLDPHYGSYVHCTCNYQTDWQTWVDNNPHDEKCRTVMPNFRHKPTGTTVDWYKYIGRSMEVNLEDNWDSVISDCLASLTK